MLNIHKHGPPIRRPGHSRHFRVRRCCEKPLDLSRLGVTREHLIVANSDKLTPIHLSRMGIGLNPQNAPPVEGNPVRAGEYVALDVAFGFSALIGCICMI